MRHKFVHRNTEKRGTLADMLKVGWSLADTGVPAVITSSKMHVYSISYMGMTNTKLAWTEKKARSKIGPW